ncbi:HoxN/HupN/NixA family nickel/cobalt transporter [Gordonia polyisoprenivorans]|uniref:HoxN/HupN/NixA family nickel/cobalt transporter n=1 Tax=Gordonia polyisoprenivorans TaxID=84595 RepID=UPI001AD78E34|nr:HoxN/HupN/NixA family nickel/cobalt transporter [Gordonia polyisoprenivorans]QTI69081.1 HoxN/HupN/NixA family nickel/cobalt transporter [Gordonia polyisoprenivorans]
MAQVNSVAASKKPTKRWGTRDYLDAGIQLSVVAVMHVVAFGVLFSVVVPHHYQLGTQVFTVGLAFTAYVFGLRHAFDADHIAAIDNTTRKLMNDGKRPKSVGFWFAMGHSTIVFVLAIMVIIGTRAVAALTNDDSPIRHALGTISTLASGGFLYLIALINVVALIAIWRVFRSMRAGHFDNDELESALNARGFLARVLNPLMRRISRPIQVYPVGVLFGLGFDTATEVALLALAGTGAVAGLPWYAILVLPLLFASGMSLMDTVDGMFMTVAYDWAFSHPARKIYYNLTITGLSVAVAFLIGTIEMISVLHDDLGWNDAVTEWISGIDLNTAGIAIVIMFVVAWLVAVAYWKIGKVESKLNVAPTGQSAP